MTTATDRQRVRAQIRHYAPGVDIPLFVAYKGQRFKFSSARTSRAIKGGIVARFVRV